MEILPTNFALAAAASSTKQADNASKSALDNVAKAIASPGDTVELSNKAQTLIKAGGPDSAFSIVGG